MFCIWILHVITTKAFKLHITNMDNAIYVVKYKLID